MTDKNDWQKVNGSNGRAIDPVPFVGENELFTPNITAEELESLIDSGGDISTREMAKKASMTWVVKPKVITGLRS